MINNLTVNYIDVIILLPLVYGAYKGFSQGLIVEMSTLFALVLGVFISLRYAVNVEGFLKDFVALPESYAYYIAFAVTFLLVIIVMHLLGKLLTKLIDMVSLGLFNKLFGIVLGVLKAAIVVCVGLIIKGYAGDVINKMPMEFAVEAQKLLQISLAGSVG